VLDEEEKKALVTVVPEEQSLAIGKGGQNVRLAAKLTNWKIDIITNETEEEIAAGKLAREEAHQAAIAATVAEGVRRLGENKVDEEILDESIEETTTKATETTDDTDTINTVETPTEETESAEEETQEKV
jgi:N utilization substance protein A